MFVLDVGCASNPKGHVNIDVSVKKGCFRAFDINPHRIKNFVKAHGEYLPFRDSTFDIVYSSHTLEHTANPLRFLQECYRVSKSLIHLIIPHRYARSKLDLRFPEYHVQQFSVMWVKRLLCNYAHYYRLIWMFKPSKFLPLFAIPHEFDVWIYKSVERGSRSSREEGDRQQPH